jgi:hypothetical protein
MGLIQNIKDIWNPPTRETAPPWEDRLLLEAAYTSPSGNRLTFDYEDVSYELDKKTAAFEFPDAGGTYVQDNGTTGRRYPLRLFFWGDNYDIEADGFLALLKETGPGVLEHPAYGIQDVVPFGSIRRRDDLKTAANQAVYEVVFWDTIGTAYPLNQSDPKSDVEAALAAYNAAAAAQFARQLAANSAIEKISVIDQFNQLLDKVEGTLGAIADAQQDVADEFQAVVDSINRGIDVLIGAPLTLAFQTKILLQAPARAVASIQANLDAYGNLASDIFGLDTAEPNGNDSQNTNAFHTNELYASGYVTGSVVSTLNAEFASRPEALAAAEAVLTQMEAYNQWIDDNYTAIGATGSGVSEDSTIDTGDGYQHLQEAAALVAGFLVQISFTLKQERRIVLDRDRSLIELAAEIHGETYEDEIDFLIQSNNLSGDEILSPGLVRGTEFVYYV